jgi:hypothetical protein
MFDFVFKSLKWFLIMIITQVIIVISLLMVLDEINLRPFIVTKNQNNKDGMVYILGNSHPECAINDSLLSGNYANIAQSAEPLFYSVIKARRLLTDYSKIDTMVIEFTNISLTTVKWVISDSWLMRNYKKHFALMNPEEHAFLFEKNPLKSIKTFFSITPFELFYNKKYVDGAYLCLVKNNIKGFDKLSIGASIVNRYEMLNNMHNEEYLGFANLLSLIKNNPQTFFIITRMPMHKSDKGLGNEKFYQNCIRQLNNNINCRYLDFLNCPLNDKDFADEEHLNYQGARKFTPIFRDSVRSISLN